MSQSYTSSLYHCVWSTRYRRRSIRTQFQQDLWECLAAIAKKKHMKALAVGGIEDHVHVLLSIPATIDIARAIQLIKGGASKWVNETFQKLTRFSWQKGYGAFSIGISQLEDTIDYINRQAEHHAQRSFQDEFVAMLDKNRISYDPQRLWD